ncbi:MAG: hypothetical protein Q8N94_04685 [Methanoregula sp.]|nr:hypothetical protein [Methanoregula sp.]
MPDIPDTMNAAVPWHGFFVRRFGSSFLSAIGKKCLSRRAPVEVAKRPHQGWDTPETKFNKRSIS